MTVSFLVTTGTLISVIPPWPTLTTSFIAMSPLWNCQFKSKHSLVLFDVGFAFWAIPLKAINGNNVNVIPHNTVNFFNFMIVIGKHNLKNATTIVKANIQKSLIDITLQ